MVVDCFVIRGFLRLVEKFQFRRETGRGTFAADNKKRGEQKQNEKEKQSEQKQMTEQKHLHKFAELLHAQKLFPFVFFFKIDWMLLIHESSFS